MPKKLPAIGRVLIFVLVLAVIGAVYCVVNRDRIGLEKYAGRCGGSLKGLRYEIVDQYRQDAFQDPWMVWAVRIGSDPAGTFYDASAFQEGPLYSGGTNVAAAFAREMEAETGGCFFASAAEPGWTTNSTLGEWGKASAWKTPPMPLIHTVRRLGHW